MSRKNSGIFKKRRGIIGVEAAIVMIAFVIVAAALAFVVLNMGFSTTQTAKQTITSSLGEASSSMEIAGSVIGIGHVTAGSLNATTIPIKIATGGKSANLDPDSVSIRYADNTLTYDNIYQGILNVGSFNGTKAALAQATIDLIIDVDPTAGLGWPSQSTAFVWFSQNDNNNNILEIGELAMLTLVWSELERPESLDSFQTEVILPTGATLSIERSIPSITNEVIPMG
jgi:flagellin FlaB